MPWHNLRHSAATIMLAEGVPIEVVSRVLGHASIRITAYIYGHVSPETNRQAADAMARLCDEGPPVRPL
jgi:integrase